MVNKNKLRGRIADAGYTQKKLAFEIGISSNSFSNKLNGKTQFKTDEVDAICDKLGIDDNSDKSIIFLSSPSQ